MTEKIYPLLLILTFMTNPWGAQEGIGNGGRGSLKVCMSLHRQLILEENNMREDYSRARKQDHNVIKTACIREM